MTFADQINVMPTFEPFVMRAWLWSWEWWLVVVAAVIFIGVGSVVWLRNRPRTPRRDEATSHEVRAAATDHESPSMTPIATEIPQDGASQS